MAWNSTFNHLIYNCHCAIYCVKSVWHPFFALHSYCIGGIVIGSNGKGMSVGMNDSKWTYI